MNAPVSSRSAPPHGLASLADLAILSGLCIVLAFAFVWQLSRYELPCPLCLLQRVAFCMAGVGPILNLRYGQARRHDAMTVLSALAGAFVAARQVLLHIQPGDPGYGGTFLGLHFYTLAFICFVVLIAAVAVKSCLGYRTAETMTPRPVGWLIGGVCGAFVVLVFGNMASTMLECGFGQCADNPVSYLWLNR